MIATQSLIVRRGVQAAGPLAVVVATYLLFAGHNRPGGGFAAGLVLGAVVALRTVAGLQRPGNAPTLVASGALLVASVALAPVVVGDVILDQVVWTGTLPILGAVKTGTALLFDIGVTLIVVGLVVAVLEGLGGLDLAGDSPTYAEPPTGNQTDEATTT